MRILDKANYQTDDAHQTFIFCLRKVLFLHTFQGGRIKYNKCSKQQVGIKTGFVNKQGYSKKDVTSAGVQSVEIFPRGRWKYPQRMQTPKTSQILQL